MKKGKDVEPCRAFVSSPVLVEWVRAMPSLLYTETQSSYCASLDEWNVTVLLTAPTGVAAFNIQGITLHSALLLGTSKFGSRPLTQGKLNTLRT